MPPTQYIQTQSIFPPRKPGTTDGELRKELAARKAPQDSVVLTLTELNIIRQMIDGVFGPAAQTLTHSRTDAAEERKRKMMAYDLERNARFGKDNLDDLERAVQREKDLEAARTKQDETLDEVKEMNKVMLNARVVAVRDAQILERQRLAAQEASDNRRMDEEMEKHRQRQVELYGARERRRAEEYKKSAFIIKDQIAEREQARLHKLEQRQQEQDMMQRHLVRMKDEDMARADAKREEARRLMEDVAIANADQIRLKQHQRQLELEEDRQIAEFIKEKERREQEFADEQQRIKAQKEREVARLRSQQEKAQDKQASLDALRAKRAEDQKERELIRKEREALERQKRMEADVLRSRLQQMEEKRVLQEQEAADRKVELEEIVALRAIANEQAEARRAAAEQLRLENQLALKKQILEVEENRRKARVDTLEEGHYLEMERRERAAVVEAIRQRKIEELQQLEVPDVYVQQLVKRGKRSDLRAAM